MATNTRIWPDIAIPPGELLAETLENLDLSQAELARRTGRPAQAINEIVRGAKEITPETALQLERVVGVPAHVWTRLEADYRFNKTRLDEQVRLKRQVAQASRYPYAAMAKLGWVRKVRRGVEQVQELLRFFGVAALPQVQLAEAAAFRRAASIDAAPQALAAWLRQGERLALNLPTARFSVSRLEAAIPTLRGLTRKPVAEIEPGLRQVLGQAGVAFALVPHLPGTGAHGATRRLSPTKALLQMSLRYAWDDVFWFSLFHELGHLLLHERHPVFIEGAAGRDHALEHQADRFAADHLLPPAAYQTFVRRGEYRHRAAVVAFAKTVGIAPSIVVGRLHHDQMLPHAYLNDLRARFEWVRHT
jgi:addiction module HigA family antidote